MGHQGIDLKQLNNFKLLCSREHLPEFNHLPQFGMQFTILVIYFTPNSFFLKSMMMVYSTLLFLVIDF